jgi:hypothetical protein
MNELDVCGTRRCSITVTTAAVFCLAGCSVDYYRAETTLHADGRVDRAIYQPRDKTPEAARASELWEQTAAAPKVEPAQFPVSIAELPAAAESEQHPYFVASGRFVSAEKVPSYYLKKSSDGTRESTLVRHTERVDHVLVIEHRWREVLTDVVELDDLHKARRELAGLVLPVFADALSAGLGTQYDVSKLLDWLRRDGVAWFEELSDAYVEISVRKDGGRDEALKQRVAEICGRHGLKLEGEKSISLFATKMLRDLVRDDNGQPPDDATVREILAWLSIEKVEQPEGEERPNLFEEATRQVIARKFGGEEAFEQRLTGLAVRILGVYGPLWSPERFTYSLAMPGKVVETTGTLAADNRVLWTFEGREAYPFGYPMSASSLEPNTAAQEKAFRRTVVTGRDELVALVDVLEKHDDLKVVLKQCIALGSAAPLEQHRINVEQSKDEAKTAALLKLWKLLKLP